jgi:hypothetical protein
MLKMNIVMHGHCLSSINDFDDHEVYDSFLREDTVSEFVSWLEQKGIDLDKLHEAAQDQ